MALFSLGTGIKVKRSLPYKRPQAFRLSKEMLDDYRGHGLKVSMIEECEGESFSASIANSEGTRLKVEVQLQEEAAALTILIVLSGKVFVGGMQGMFASDSKVRKIAKERLSALLGRVFNLAKNPVEAVEDSEDEKDDKEDLPEDAVESVSEEGPEVAGETVAADLANSELVGDVDAGPVEEEPSGGVKENAEVERVTAVVAQEIESGGDGKDIEDKIVVSGVDLGTTKLAERSLEERLRLLKKMLNHELINQEDYKQKKCEILASI
jgi:hypothetical protein